MKVVIGLKDMESFKDAVDLLRSVDFAWTAVHVVHVIERLGRLGWEHAPDDSIDQITRLMKAEEVLGRELLAAAAAELARRGTPCETFLRQGFAANQLIRHADSVDADLIVVTTRRYGQSPLAGSNARKLAVAARQSLLLVKPREDRGWRGTAVFATDLSPYADACLARFAAYRPRGLERVFLMTAVPPQTASAPGLGEIVHKTTRRCRDLARELGAFDGVCEPVVREGPVSAAIDETMARTEADLLVMGAQGHGMLDRIILGSTSFHQVVTTPHSLLIVRAESFTKKEGDPDYDG